MLPLSVACSGVDLDGSGGSSTSTGLGADTDGSTESGTVVDPTLTSTSEPTDGSAGSTAESTAATLDGTTETPACELPALEQEVLDQLFIAGGVEYGVAAGSDAQLRLQWIDAGFPNEVEACVEWSIEPVEGVSIDDTGLLSVDASVPAGTSIFVTANVEDGRRLVEADFEVYVPVDYDILGLWLEVEQLPCDGGPAFEPDPVIGELVFQNTGDFSVTWTPFEVYYDYWGTFTYDEATGALALAVEGGNYVPADIDAEGTATVTGGQLVLEDMWLGVAMSPVTPVACGHVFE